MKLPVLTKTGQVIDAYGYSLCYHENEDFYIGFPDGHVKTICSTTHTDYSTWNELSRTLISPELELSSLPEEVVQLLLPGESLVKHVIDQSAGIIIYGGIALTNFKRAIVYGVYINPKVIERIRDVFLPVECGFCVLTADGVIREVAYTRDGSCKRSLERKNHIESWNDIIKVSCATSSHLLALKSDGTVLAEGYTDWNICKVNDWHNIIDVYCDHCTSYGLCEDGSTVSTGLIKENKSFHEVSMSKSYTSGLPHNISFEGMEHVLPIRFGTISWEENGRITLVHLDPAKVDNYETTLKIKRIIQSDEFDELFYIITDNGSTYEFYSHKGYGLHRVPELNNVIQSKKLIVLQENGQCWERMSTISGVQYLLVDNDVVDIGYGDEYFFRLYSDNHAEIEVYRNIRKYPQLHLAAIQAVYPTATHVIFLHKDGHVSFMGNNTKRCCNKLDKYTNVKKIIAEDDKTTLYLDDGRIVSIPPGKARDQA